MTKRQWHHNPIGQIAGAPPAAGDPHGYVWESDNTQHIVYRGTDNHIHEIWYRKGILQRKWEYGGSLTQRAKAPLAASDPIGYVWEDDKSQHVIYRGQDNQVHELWFKHGMVMSGNWSYGGALSSKVGAPPAQGMPYGYVWDHDKTQHIIYRGTDNNIHEIWFEHGRIMSGEWKYGGAINSKVGAPAAASDPTGYAWEKDKSQHIVYLGADKQVYELWFRHGWVTSNWKYEGSSLSSQAGAPPSAGTPYSYIWEEDQTQHVVYLGNDNQIHEIWFAHGAVTSGSWKYGGALSQTTGGPPAASDPMGYTWEDDNTQHIIYRGQDNQIHELWQRKATLSSAAWKYEGSSLTSMANAPLAQGNPAGFAWESDNTQHVIYRGQDNQIHELWYRK